MLKTFDRKRCQDLKNGTQTGLQIHFIIIIIISLYLMPRLLNVMYQLKVPKSFYSQLFNTYNARKNVCTNVRGMIEKFLIQPKENSIFFLIYFIYLFIIIRTE